MVLRCHPAHRDILHAAEDSNSGQMKICSCSFSKWSLITYHMLDAVLGVWYMWQQLRHGPHSSGVYLPAEEIVCVCVKNFITTRWNGRCRGSDGGSEEGVEAGSSWEEVNSVLSFGRSELVVI